MQQKMKSLIGLLCTDHIMQYVAISRITQMQIRGELWPSGRASDFESRGPGFGLHWDHCVVSLSKTH